MKHTSRRVRFDKLTANLQYSYVSTLGNSVYARSRTPDGAPVYTENKLCPLYFLPVDDESNADAWGFDGTPLASHMCDSLKDGKAFVEEHPEAFGDIQPEYMFLSDVYGANDAPCDLDRLYIWFLDIEVDRDKVRGFAPVEDPFNPVIAITVKWRHMGETGVVVYGTGDYSPAEGVTYVRCTDESDLLRKFLADFRGGSDYPDIVSGWNVQGYDMPYLVNRMRLLFPEEVWLRLSPFERIYDREQEFYGQKHLNVDIKGITILDYYELYRKFTLTQRENYKLDHIAHVELNKRKVNYREVRSLDRLYREDHQKFIEYNIQDVNLVCELDDKLKILELVTALAYGAKCNFGDTFKQVRLWDIMIYHKLRSEGKQIPPRKNVPKPDQYEGAFVKEPIPGFYKWVVSFDVASMYPHIIREWNLSPETLADKVKLGSVDDFLARKVDTDKYKEFAVAANGALTRKEAEGFLPNMLKTLYDERNRFKGLAKKAKQAAENEPDPVKKKQHLKDFAAFNNQQQVRKVNLNSAYGALGSNYFRFFDIRLAEAVTVTGQLAIRWVARDVNDYLNKVLNNPKNPDLVIASDTDSIYMNMEGVAKKYLETKPDATTIDVVNMLDAFSQKHVMPVIEASFVSLAEYLHVYLPCLSMVRDVITDKAVWTAKKRYIMHVYDSEGTRYKTPQLKMMGIEAIKSSTPAMCRKMITDTLQMLMTGTQKDVWKHIAKCRQDFRSAPFEDVAFPRAVKGLRKYAGQDKSVPIHVRGALAYNQALEARNQTTQFAPIHEGEKIKYAYLREPNVFHTYVLSAPDAPPPDWNVEQYIDYDKQFDKTFIEPVSAILQCAGWTVEYRPTLFDDDDE